MKYLVIEIKLRSDRLSGETCISEYFYYGNSLSLFRIDIHRTTNQSGMLWISQTSGDVI